jgi:hypothetical protein
MAYFKQNRGDTDLLYLRLRRDISKWYDTNGDSEAKALHLHLLRKNYDPARFVSDIGLERVKFLTELQEIVDVRSLYGMAGLS